jgi:hypothetical protein
MTSRVIKPGACYLDYICRFGIGFRPDELVWFTRLAYEVIVVGIETNPSSPCYLLVLTIDNLFLHHVIDVPPDFRIDYPIPLPETHLMAGGVADLD